MPNGTSIFAQSATTARKGAAPAKSRRKIGMLRMPTRRRHSVGRRRSRWLSVWRAIGLSASASRRSVRRGGGDQVDVARGSVTAPE